MLMGDALYNLRRYPEAAENYDRAGNAGPYPGFAFYNAGRSWALAGDRDRALTSVEKAVATGFIAGCENRRNCSAPGTFERHEKRIC